VIETVLLLGGLWLLLLTVLGSRDDPYHTTITRAFRLRLEAELLEHKAGPDGRGLYDTQPLPERLKLYDHSDRCSECAWWRMQLGLPRGPNRDEWV
jgi:hypothetical protein